MSNVNINVKVTIPVTAGGYTGQRDEWESRTTPYEVTMGDGTNGEPRVMLQETHGTALRQFVFSRADLESALQFLEERVG